MANKKRKKKRSGNAPAQNQPRSERAASTHPDNSSEGESEGGNVSAASVERRAKKELARQERQKALRSQKRSQVFRKSAFAGIAVGITIVVVALLIHRAPKQASSTQIDKLIAQAPAATKLAGCDSVQTIPPYNPEANDRQHITGTPPALSTYQSTPPASGPHNPVPLSAGVYPTPPDVWRTIHSMEHAGVVLWFAPTAPKAALTPLETFVKNNQDHTLMAQYSYPGNGDASSLPSGKLFALVAWHRLQLCDKVPMTPVIADFMSKYRFPTLGNKPYVGAAPEKGVAI